MGDGGRLTPHVDTSAHPVEGTDGGGRSAAGQLGVAVVSTRAHEYRPKRYVRSTLNVSKRPSLELKTSMRTAYEVSSVIHTRESIVIDRKFRYVTDVTDVTNG